MARVQVVQQTEKPFLVLAGTDIRAGDRVSTSYKDGRILIKLDSNGTKTWGSVNRAIMRVPREALRDLANTTNAHRSVAKTRVYNDTGSVSFSIDDLVEGRLERGE